MIISRCALLYCWHYTLWLSGRQTGAQTKCHDSTTKVMYQDYKGYLNHFSNFFFV